MTYVFAQPTTGFIVSSSIVIGVLGLAMQNSLSDVVAGVAISIERPFHVGDWIEFDDGMLGEVIDINWRATHVMSWHGTLYVIPNNRISNARIHNYSHPTELYGHWFLVNIPSSVAPETAKRILLRAAVNCPAVLKDPAPVVRTADTGASWAYRMFVFFRTYKEHPKGMDDLLSHIWLELERHGIKAASVTSETVLRRGEATDLRGESPTELLKQVRLFQNVDPETLDSLVRHVRLHTVPAEAEIVRQGEVGTSMFVLSTGLVRVLIAMGGTEPREVAKLTNGEYFGEMSMLTHEPRTASVVAHTDCHLLEIGEDAMQAVFARDPNLMDDMAHIVSVRRLMNQAMAEELTQEDFARRIGQLTAKLAARIRTVFTNVHGQKAAR